MKFFRDIQKSVDFLKSDYEDKKLCRIPISKENIAYYVRHEIVNYCPVEGLSLRSEPTTEQLTSDTMGRKLTSLLVGMSNYFNGNDQLAFKKVVDDHAEYFSRVRFNKGCIFEAKKYREFMAEKAASDITTFFSSDNSIPEDECQRLALVVKYHFSI